MSGILRLLVLVLLLLNLALLAWGQGWLLAYGWGLASQREPQRLAQQVRPQALLLLADPALMRTPSAESSAQSACLQSALLNEAQAASVRKLLEASWPADAWVLDKLAAPERWIIYMGKVATVADLEKKRLQLGNLRLTFYPLGNPALDPGLSLGVYPSQQQASDALEALKLRGVRTARLLQDTAAGPVYRLRLPMQDEARQKQLAPVTAALAGQPLTPCAAVSPPP